MSTSTNKLYRSKADRVIAGVCGGLAERFGMPALLLRILFVLLVNASWIVYILMWIMVPTNPNQKPGNTSTLTKIVLAVVLFYVAFMTVQIIKGYLPQ